MYSIPWICMTAAREARAGTDQHGPLLRCVTEPTDEM